MREAGCVVWASPPAEATPVTAEETSLNVLIGCAYKASAVLERLAAREGISIPFVEPGSCALRLCQVAAAARALAEMGVRASRGPDDGEASRAWLTPQQATEMWQPWAVELGPSTLPALVGILGTVRSAGGNRRSSVAVLCTLRLLTVHLLLYDRCALDAAAALDDPSASRSPSPGALRRQLLDALVELALAPLPGVSPDLGDAVQAEAILALTAGLRSLFPVHAAQLALLHACAVRAERCFPASPGIQALVAALCAAVAAHPGVSRLVVASEDDVPTEALGAMLPKVLCPAEANFGTIQSGLRSWLLRNVVAEARIALASDAPPSPDDRSPCMRLLASLVQELVARASLCAHHRDPPNAALAGMAEELLRAATALLEAGLPPARSAAALEGYQSRLAPTFLGSLLPWLVDSLALFSAFAFEHAHRLLPLVLPLLHTLRAALAPGRTSAISAASRSPPELAQHTLLQSAHPYKVPDEQDKKSSRRALPACTHEEEGAWPGATQLQLRFDSQCCTEEGDWLTLSFFRQNLPVPGRTLRLGGPWANWPKAPFTVPADAVRASFVFSPSSSQPHERWGYSISVTATRRDKTCELTTPPLDQLRVSLTYLGAKCAALLVAAEPVVAEEKDNRHWLRSPLFARGLPLQLPPDHSLMHPFFGIQPPSASRGSAGLVFLDDLVHLGGGPATLLHRRMSGEAEAAEQGHATAAQRALLASLLSHNRLLHTARRAARQLAAEGGAAGRAGAGAGGEAPASQGDPPAARGEPATLGEEEAATAEEEPATLGDEAATAGREPATAGVDPPDESCSAGGSAGEEAVGQGEGAASDGNASDVESADGPAAACLLEVRLSFEDAAGAGNGRAAPVQPCQTAPSPGLAWVGTVLPEAVPAANSEESPEQDATLDLPVTAAEWGRLRSQWRSARSLFARADARRRSARGGPRRGAARPHVVCAAGRKTKPFRVGTGCGWQGRGVTGHGWAAGAGAAGAAGGGGAAGRRGGRRAAAGG
jgi:hypothetical protein